MSASLLESELSIFFRFRLFMRQDMLCDEGMFSQYVHSRTTHGSEEANTGDCCGKSHIF